MTQAISTMPVLDRHSVAVVVPALNEALRIREVVTGALEHADRVILIDDGSDDGTVDQVADLPVTVLRHERRLGKGASLRDGFAEALRQGALAVITMDGDGQHHGSDIPRLIAAGNRHPGWLVNGARLRRREQQPFHRRVGNDFGDWGISWGCGLRIRDTQSGQRLYPAAACTLGDIPGEDFVYEAQLLISCARQLGMRVVSVPIEARYKSVHSAEKFRRSHFRPLRDLWRISSHVARQILARGHLLREYRRTRSHRPVIDDADGVLNATAAPAMRPAA